MARKKLYDREAVLGRFREYIDNTDIPIWKEFTTREKIPPSSFNSWPESQQLLVECTAKKEAAIERLALEGKINVTQAIFSLKQLGWRDKNELGVNGSVNFNIVLPKGLNDD